MTCEDAIWGLGSWVVSHVDVNTLRKLVDGDDSVIDATAESVYGMAEEAKVEGSGELRDLLGVLSSWREHPSTRGAHLSGLRSALRYVGKSTKQYPSHARSKRLDLYRQLLLAPATSKLEFQSPAVVLQGAAA